MLGPVRYPPTLRDLSITIRTCLWMAEHDDPSGAVSDCLALMAEVCNRRIVATVLDDDAGL